MLWSCNENEEEKKNIHIFVSLSASIAEKGRKSKQGMAGRR
jgi:hypothetical protein